MNEYFEGLLQGCKRDSQRVHIFTEHKEFTGFVDEIVVEGDILVLRDEIYPVKARTYIPFDKVEAILVKGS